MLVCQITPRTVELGGELVLPDAHGQFRNLCEHRGEIFAIFLKAGRRGGRVFERRFVPLDIPTSRRLVEFPTGAPAGGFVPVKAGNQKRRAARKGEQSAVPGHCGRKQFDIAKAARRQFAVPIGCAVRPRAVLESETNGFFVVSALIGKSAGAQRLAHRRHKDTRLIKLPIH